MSFIKALLNDFYLHIWLPTCQAWSIVFHLGLDSGFWYKKKSIYKSTRSLSHISKNYTLFLFFANFLETNTKEMMLIKNTMVL